MWKFLKEYRWFIAMFGLGYGSALTYLFVEIDKATAIAGILMVVALYASLRLPFQAFSRKEKIHKWVLQNAPLVSFGVFARLVVLQPTAVMVVLMVASMAMHLGYWTNGIHSRVYRVGEFRAAYAQDYPFTNKLIASLNAKGCSEVGNDFACCALDNLKPTEELWNKVPHMYAHLFEAVRAEFEKNIVTAVKQAS